MITFVFETNSGLPLYEQLYNFIRGEIEKKNIKADEKLPSKRKLSDHLKVSPITIETAYAQLLAEGYIRSVPKSGYFAQNLDSVYMGNIENVENIKSAESTETELFLFRTVRAENKPRIESETQIKNETRTNNEPQYKFNFRTNAVDIDDFPFSTWAKISRKILSEKQNELLKTIEHKGLYELRQEISKYLYKFRGISAEPEQIIIGAGSEYLISMIVKLLGNDKIYGAENPGYHKIYKIFKSNGAKVRSVELDNNGLSVNRLQEAEADIVHVTPSHHFPLGIVMPIQRRLELIAWAKEKAGRYIIEDDYDSEFRFGGKPIQTLQRLNDSGQVIYLNTFAMSLAPSMRISYMVLPYYLLEKYNKKLYFYSCTVPSFEQYILADFMKNNHFERHLSRMKNIYKIRQDVLINSIKSCKLNPVTEVNGRDAGLHLLLTVKNGMTEDQLVSNALSRGIKVYGLSEYYNQSISIPQNTIIAGYSGLKNNDITEAVAELETAWIKT